MINKFSYNIRTEIIICPDDKFRNEELFEAGTWNLLMF